MNYFGKGCDYLSCMFENKDDVPVLVFCTSYRNSLNAEGNCCEKYCPLNKTNKDFGV